MFFFYSCDNLNACPNLFQRQTEHIKQVLQRLKLFAIRIAFNYNELKT